ncbi:MAG TPA: helix-turn-helix domain-containing protein [Nakamurella sp.]|nr:helix-turn-helix domain-containing protein [Nakamurella sp.]
MTNNAAGRPARWSAPRALGPRPARSAANRMSGPRAAVLDAVIGAAGPVTVADLAGRLGQHPNTVREHLDALVLAGRVERERARPAGRGRPAWLYRIAGPAPAGAHREQTDPARAGTDGTFGDEYAALALALINQLASTSPDPRGMALEAGARWGRTLAAKPIRSGGGAERAGAAVVELLTDLRFSPEPDADGRTVRLTTCPLLDAARVQPDLVCGVHLGIVRGVLDRLGGDPAGADLVPFAEPGACVLTLPPRP